MTYKKTFSSGELIRSADQNDNFNVIQSSMHYIDATFLTAQINGTVTTFGTQYPYITGSLDVCVDGIELQRLSDFTEGPGDQSFAVLGVALISTTCGYQTLSAKYIRRDI